MTDLARMQRPRAICCQAISKTRPGWGGPGCRGSCAYVRVAATAELVYWHQIVPALTRGAELMDRIFG